MLAACCAGGRRDSSARADSSGADDIDAVRSGRDASLQDSAGAENGTLEEGRALFVARAGRKEPRPSWLGRIFESAVFFWACVVFAPGMQVRRGHPVAGEWQ